MRSESRLDIIQRLWFAGRNHRRPAFELLLIQSDQTIVHLFRQGNIDRIAAAYPVVGGDGSRAHGQCGVDGNQFDDG